MRVEDSEGFTRNTGRSKVEVVKHVHLAPGLEPEGRPSPSQAQPQLTGLGFSKPEPTQAQYIITPWWSLAWQLHLYTPAHDKELSFRDVSFSAQVCIFRTGAVIVV